MAEAQQVIAVVLLGVVALIGIAVLSPLIGVATDMGQSAGDETIEPVNGGETYELDQAVNEEPSQLSLSPTREIAVAFDGDGHISDEWETFGEGDWSVAVTAQLDDSANEKATYSVLAIENASVLVEYHDGDWRAIHYEGEDSATAAVEAAEPTEFTGLVVSWDSVNEELTLYENGDNSDTGALTATDPDRRVANDWYGTIDEVRLFDDSVSQATAEAYADDPVQPLADEDHHARYMFNEGQGDSTEPYYSESTATIHGGSWTSGVAAPEMVEGEDYTLSFDPLTVTIVSSGYLDGAPVAFVSWDSGLGGAIGSIIGGVGSAMALIPIIMLVMMAAILLALVQRMR